MTFPDPSVPIATCRAADCTDCPVAEVIDCHSRPVKLAQFLLISTPSFLVGGAGVLISGLTPLLIWIAVIVGFFGFVEIRVMCSHCPHYVEKGNTLGCWANHGIPKLWNYRPGPMSIVEKAVFLGGFVVVWGYPLPFIIAGGHWLFLGLYVLLTTGFFVTLKVFFCSHCMNFACPLNSVAYSVRNLFFDRNPSIGDAWNRKRNA